MLITINLRLLKRNKKSVVSNNRLLVTVSMGFVSSDGDECVCMSGKNLFHRAIVQSGSALSSWGVATRPLHYARRLAEAVNCSTTTDHHQSTDFIACFKRLSARVLVDAPVPGAACRYLSALGPTVDGKTVLPSAVRVLVNKDIDSVLGRTPLLVGVTSDEGQIFLSQSDVDQVLSLNVLVVSQLRPRSERRSRAAGRHRAIRHRAIQSKHSPAVRTKYSRKNQMWKQISAY